MVSSQDKLLHLIRYGITREAQYLSGIFLNTYDMLVFNGNMAAYMPSALTSFLVSKVFDKPFMVDPMTHVFQHSLSNISSDSTGDPRKSLLKLAFALGDPVVSKLNGQEPVTPVDFCGSNSVDKFVRRAVSFQLEGFRHSAEESGDIEYFHYLGIDNPLEPYFVVAPYFYMDETNIEQWWKLNLEFLDRAVSLFGKKHRVICQMVVDEGALEHSRLSDYIASVGVSNAWGVAIWVDNLDETTASSKMLSRYVNVIRALGATKRVIIPYGSYFSSLPELVFLLLPVFRPRRNC